MTLGERLIAARKSKKMSRAKIAKLAGVNTNQYRNYETGKCNPPFDKACKIADALEVTLNYLAGKPDEIYKPEGNIIFGYSCPRCHRRLMLLQSKCTCGAKFDWN